MVVEQDKRIRRVLEVTLNVPLAELDNPRREEIAGWDSLTHLEIVFALEDEFDVRFAENEIIALDSYDSIVSLLRAKNSA